MVNIIELKNLRAVLKMNQSDFAKLLGISRQQLSSIERGKSGISKKVDERYNRLVGNTITIPATRAGWARGVDCPFCNTMDDPKRVYYTDVNGKRIDESSDIDAAYRCPNCKRVFTAGYSWHLRDEARERAK